MSGHGAPTLFVDGTGARVAVVASRWHTEVMDGLIAGAERALADAKVEDVTIVRAPGSFELPILCQAYARQGFDAIIALGVNGGAYAIEIIRGGVQSINKGQVEAGLALGLHKLSVFRFIVLKPALRAVFPSLASQFVLLTLTTSIASAVSAYELTSVAKRVESDSFRSFEVYGVVTLMYLVMSWIVMNILNFISSRYISTYPVK